MEKEKVKCLAHVEDTGKRCKKNALPLFKYCWSHQPLRRPRLKNVLWSVAVLAFTFIGAPILTGLVDDWRRRAGLKIPENTLQEAAFTLTIGTNTALTASPTPDSRAENGATFTSKLPTIVLSNGESFPWKIINTGSGLAEAPIQVLVYVPAAWTFSGGGWENPSFVTNWLEIIQPPRIYGDSFQSVTNLVPDVQQVWAIGRGNDIPVQDGLSGVISLSSAERGTSHLVRFAVKARNTERVFTELRIDLR